MLFGFYVYNQTVQHNAMTIPKLKFAHIFINNHMLCRSNFRYMFRPADGILRENSDREEYMFDIKGHRRRA